MAKVLAEVYFVYFIVPLIGVFLPITLKIISRNDRFSTFRKNDLASTG